MSDILALSSFTALREHVLKMLCQKDHLDESQTPLTEQILFRKGKPCGIFYQAQGPRLVRTYAIWAGEENRILFYDAAGERFFETKLSESPDPEKLAA